MNRGNLFFMKPVLFCFVLRGSTDDLLLLPIISSVVWRSRDLQLSRITLYLLSPRLCFFIVLKRDLFVYRDLTICNFSYFPFRF